MTLKKNKILNIVLTAMMLLSTILTPQISYAISDGLNGDDAEETSQTDPDENNDTADENVEENIETDDNTGGEDSAEVEETNAGNEEADAEDENAPVEDDAVEDETPEDINNNDPPTDEEDVEDEGEVADDEAESEEDADAEETISEDEEPAAFSDELFAEIEENIFTFSSLSVNGNEIDNDDTIDIDEDTVVEVEFFWDTEGLDIQSGDTASMQLPEIFQQLSTPDTDIITSGMTVGTYSIQEGELIFVFNETIEDGEVSNGTVGLNLNFNMEKFEENIEQVIPFNDKVDTELNVMARPHTTASDITKEGNPDQSHNASEITWTVEVMNNSEEVTEATLSDILPDGLGTPENFVVTELSTGLYGDKIVGEQADISPSSVEDNEFIFEFDSIDPYQGYRIGYTTSVNDRNATEFTNDAIFTIGGNELPADVTVSGLTASNPIEKSGEYNGDTGQIDWIIVANENGFNIENAIIDDELPAGLTVDEESIIVNRYVDGDDAGTINLESNNFPFELGGTAANEHYVINFSTDIDYAEVNEANYQVSNSFINTSTLNDGDRELAQGEATVGFDREPLLEKSGQSLVDYDNKTLSWTIDVNRAQHPLTDLTITDSIPAGLSISENNIGITNQDGESITANIDINSSSEDPQEVIINLTDVGTQHLTINYTTEIEDFNTNTFNNTVSIGGEGVGDEDHNTDYEINPPTNSFGKDFRGIDYGEKTMDWRLSVDPRREAITSLTIEDTFPNKGMILDPSTVEINHSAYGPLNPETDYTLTPRSDEDMEGYQKGFIIEFIGDAVPLDDGELTVDYTTSYDPQFEVEDNTLDDHLDEEGQSQVYLNQALYTGDTENNNSFEVEEYASTTVRDESWNSGYKEGRLIREGEDGNLVEGWESGSERKIAWELYTNYQQQNLGSDVEITDTLEYDGDIDEDSIRVSVYDVDADGDTSNTNEVLDPSAYTLDVTGDQFTLTFNQEVSERYVVEFLTTVPEISQERYTNNAVVNVDGTEYPYTNTISYENYDNFLDKSAIGQEGSDVYIGDELNWAIPANDSLSIINEAEITDIISEGMEYVEGTFELSTKDGTSLSEGEDYTFSNTKTEDNRTVLAIEFNDPLNQALVLNYTTVVTAEDGDSVSNEVSLNGVNFEEATITSEELTAEQFSWVSGEFNENRGALEITKADSETGEPIENNSATFELYYELNGERVLFADDIQTDDSGQITIGNLPLRTYYLQEVEAPTGYVIDEEEQVIEVTEPYGTEEHVYEVEFTNTIEKTDLSVTKEWDDVGDQAGFRPDNIDVQLYANDEEVEDGVQTLSEDNEWTYNGQDLDAYLSNGSAIEYRVDEINVPDEYESISEIDEDGNITIINSHTPETIEFDVSKEWNDNDNQDDVRPNNVTVNLLNGSEVVTEAVLDEENSWQHTFTDLPKYDDGEEIQYRVTEDAVAEYSTSIETVGTEERLESVVTNSYTPDETTARVTKLWNDENNQDGNRPESIEVQLLANGENHGEPVVLTETSNWTYTWDGLALNADGEEINYTVSEIEPSEDYEVSTNNNNRGNLTITNSYEPETIDIPVVKSWDDSDNQDDIRPNNVTVNLLANGEVESTTILDAEGGWQHTFTDLPVYENGTEINYTITENTVEDYSTSIEADPEVENGYIINNQHTPDKTSVTVTKAWDDSNNQDGNRPNDIQVQLLADGETQGEPVTLMEAEGWTYTWSGLDANADGEAIEYTVEEINASDDYTVSVDNSDHGNIIITNSSEPELIDIPVQKIWEDADDQDEERPEQITLNLLNDRAEIVKSAVVQTQNGNEWEYTFENVPKFEDGTEIDYSVTEDFVSDYSTDIEKNDDGTHVVTNSYTPDDTSVTVTKGWNDSNNQDGNRPDEIEVQLLAGGEELGDPVTLTTGNWTHTWNGLDLNADGNAIDYSVEEVNVPEGYTSAINDENHGNITITNSYEPELLDIPVQKIWDDADNQDGVRPDRVEVNLLADGEKIREAHITEATDWQHEFTDLPRFKVGQEGQEVEYTLNENNIEGYSLTNIEFNEETETHELTNSHTPEETNVTVTKSWNDAENQDGNRPDDIKVQLLADGDTLGEPVEISAETDWTNTWQELDAYAEGAPINYSVEEINISEEYDVTVNDSDHGNIMIRNNYEPELIDIPVQKVWDDAGNQDDIRPERVMVDLLADGEKIREAHITEDSDTEDSDWTHTFTGLPKYKEGQQGQEVNYTLYESPVENYVNDINFNEDTDEYVITNSYTPETIEISGTKTWNDENDQDGFRPETITVNLLDEDEELVDTLEVEADTDGNWNYTFTDVPLNKPGEVGQAASYTVEEAVVDEYTSTVDGHDLTNTHIPYTRDLSVNKVWADANNQDGIRPGNVEVTLLADGEIFEDPITLSEENNWSYTWEDLAVNEAGESIVYSVQEVNVPEGYESTAGDIEEDSITITNKHEPETMNIPVNKVWNDEDNQDGIRPETVTVNLLANGTQIDSHDLTLENDWSHTFETLPVYSAGEEISYTLTENTVEDYSPEIDNEEYTITNNYTPEETVVTVTKNWDDANNQDGNRAENIEVQLIGNDEEVGEPVVLNAENNWTYSWSGLALNDAGSEIDYSVVELNTPEEYEVNINAEDHGNIIISNSYTPETINVDGVKTWDDAENQDGIRPETVTINLLADGNPADSLDISAEDNWNYEFTNLPKFEDGEEIVYTVEEEEVAGYEASYEGTDITNTHIPELINIPGNKIWDDADNQDGERPETITVDLLANGTVVDSVEVSEETNWSFEFTDVPKYTEGQEGVEVVYTLQEANVEGYSTEIDDYEITNSYTPGQTSVNVVKSWDDENNLDARPEAITVNLLADGEAIDSAELTAENNWQADFLELDEYANGELIEYTVEEVTPHGFVTEAVKGNAGDGFIVTNRPAKVSVGDYVWFDENKDGLQDDTDVPLEGVILTIEDENGDPVTDVYGNPVEPTTTDEKGWYTFDNLPIDNTYTVRIDREAFEELYPELVPTLEEVGDDNTVDSSIWVATSRHLTEDGDRDPTLDFGFVKEEPETPEEPEEPEEPEDETPGKPGDPDDPEDSTDPSDAKDPKEPTDSDDGDDESGLPTTGEAVTYTGLAVLLLIAGIGLVYYERKSTR